jgi:hypothetical protein
LRVRSEIHEIDSVIVSALKVGIPRTTVEYKFLANSEHYPALWVTATLLGSTETITSIRYRDMKRNLASINKATNNFNKVKTYPNPVSKGVLNIEIPTNWKNYQLALYDIQGKLILATENTNRIDMNSIASGRYVVQLISGSEIGYSIVEN